MGSVKTRASWVMAGKVGGSVGVLTIYWLLAIELNPSAFGEIVLLHSLVTVAIAVGQFGTKQMVLRDIAQASVGAGEVSVTGIAAANLALCILGCLAAGTVLGLIASYFSGVILGYGGFLGIVFWTVGFGISGVIGEGYRGLGRLREAAVLGSVIPAAGACFAVSAHLLFGRFSTGLTVSTVGEACLLLGAGYGIGGLAGCFAFSRHVGFGSFKYVRIMFERGRFRTLAIFSVYGVLSIALSQADVWAVGLLGGANLAGAYGFATKFVAFVALPLFVFNGMSANRIVQLEAMGVTERLERLLRGGAAASFLAAALIMGVVACVFPLLAGLYENKLLLAVGFPVLLILGCGQLVNAFAGSCGIVLLYIRGQATMLKIILCTVGSAVLALTWLGEEVGAATVALVFFAAMTAQNFLMWITVRRTIGLKTQASFRELFVNPSGFFSELKGIGR